MMNTNTMFPSPTGATVDYIQRKSVNMKRKLQEVSVPHRGDGRYIIADSKLGVQ